MASTTKFFFFMVLFYLVVMQEASECSIRHGCFYAKAASQQIGNRKVLYGSEDKEAVFKSGVHGPTISGSSGNLAGWELRNAPSGPDPLHHNGGSSKKPNTP